MVILQKRILVCGAGGFIGGHLVRRLKNEGAWVMGVDIKHHEHSPSSADKFSIGDLRDPHFVGNVFEKPFDEVYQLAADMGGAGYLFSGENDADVMRNSSLINLNVLDSCRQSGSNRVFFSSSACVYPEYNQLDPTNPNCEESTIFPAQPDSEYGWEKIFSERLYRAYAKNHGLACRIARYHNIFGPLGTWQGGKEKAPAAMCRKVNEAETGGSIEIWGDGKQTRSFLYVDECIEGTIRLMRSEVDVPVNIGSELMIEINELAQMAIKLSGKRLSVQHVDGPLGVRGRRSDNRLIAELLDWAPRENFWDGFKTTYGWITSEFEQTQASGRRPVLAR